MSEPTDTESTKSEVPSEFHRACAVDDVVEGGTLGVEIDGEPVMIARSQGEFFALKDVCSHEEVALSEGEIDHGAIECWLHGSRFDLRTGAPLELPATEPVDVYPVRVTDGEIYVSLNTRAPLEAIEQESAT